MYFKQLLNSEIVCLIVTNPTNIEPKSSILILQQLTELSHQSKPNKSSNSISGLKIAQIFYGWFDVKVKITT